MNRKTPYHAFSWRIAFIIALIASPLLFPHINAADTILNSEHHIPANVTGTPEVSVVADAPVTVQYILDSSTNPNGFLVGWDSEEWWHPMAAGSATLRLRYKILSVTGPNVSIVIKGYRRLSGEMDYWRKAVTVTGPTSDFVDFNFGPQEPGMQFVPGAENNPKWQDVNFFSFSLVGGAGASLTIQLQSPGILNSQGQVITSFWQADRTTSGGADPFRVIPQMFRQASDNTGVTGNLATGRGLFLIGRGSNILQSTVGRDTLLGLKDAVGDYGMAANVAFPALSREQAWMQQNLAGVVYQQGGAYGLSEYISEADAWLTAPDGSSRNHTPGLGGLTGAMKHFDAGSPAVWTAFGNLLNRLAASRVKEFQLIETYWPHTGGLWGHGEPELVNLRTSLSGADTYAERPVFNEDGVAKRLGFWDYFRARHGFTWEPEDLGFTAGWADFVPPTVGGPGAIPANDMQGRKRYLLMSTLSAYQVIKFYQRVGWHAYEVDVKQIKLSVIPNNEHYNNSFDWLAYQSGRYPHVVGFEYFGNPKNFSAYEKGPVWNRMFALRDKPGTPKEQRMVLETSVMGLGSNEPYWDPEVTYITTYDLVASQQPDSVENDWVNWVDADIGTNAQMTRRFSDFVLKALALNHAREDNAWRPLPGQTGTEGFYGLLDTRSLNQVKLGNVSQNQLYKSASSLHFPSLQFDLSQVRGLGNFDLPPNILVDDQAYHLPEDIAWLRGWLSGSIHRVLVAHGFSLGKVHDGTNYSEAWNEFRVLNAPSQTTALLGSPLSFSGFLTFSGQNVVGGSDWAGDPLFDSVTINGMIAHYNYSTPGVVLLSINGCPLVSKVRIYDDAGLPKGVVYYLHFRPGASTTAAVEKAVLAKILGVTLKRDFLPAGNSIENYKLRRYRTNDGLSVVGYHPQALDDFNFVYDPTVVQKLPYADPAYTGSFKVRLSSELGAVAGGTVAVINMISGNLSHQPVTEEMGSLYITLSLTGRSCGLWQIVRSDDQDAQQAYLSRVEDLSLYFPSTAQ
ncbi:hypothetical protein OH491_26955 [Termitidicoccus mucosus]|uniref:Uncharacterized protein n=1 Tax=Termitidicoccus mucosus TaxID=1184151 RepID=A0A178IB68_9BACT|nr:hypothetical protein AW736_23810 [Opitutaceae bacterium TSB47]